MLTRKRFWLVVVTLGVTAACGAPLEQGGSPPVAFEDRVTLPDGFRLSVWADNLVRPRSLALADDGTVFVGTYYFTKGLTSPVLVLRDTDGDGLADFSREISNGFNTPNGVDIHDGTLYIVDEGRVWRIPRVLETLDASTAEVIYNDLPSRAETEEATHLGHWWRYLVYGPDDKLYITVGTRWSIAVGAHSANDIGDQPRYSSVVRMNPDGTGFETYAEGVRNSMGMAFHPVTGQLYFTDNGSSWPFEDPRFYDIPPDELNRSTASGEHFGFPWIHGRLPDPFSGANAPPGTTAPVYEFAAHSATLGLEFYTGDMFPAEYRNRIFVAEHGTEATTPADPSQVHGDRISMITLDDAGNAVDYRVFVDGFFRGSNANYDRRPVDLLVLHDGSLLISDDQAGAIYRVWYEG